MPKLLTQYHTANPSVELAALDISRLSELHRAKVASAYADKKVFRQCTDVKKHALEGAWILASSDAKTSILLGI